MADVADIASKSAIVVIGASGALGSAFMRHLATRTDGIVVGTVRATTPESTRSALRNIAPEQVVLVELDVGDPPSVRNAAAQVGSIVSRVDMLVNCAAVNVAAGLPRAAAKGPLRSVRPDALMELMRINAIGPVLVAQAFAGLLSAAERPWLVTMSTDRASLAAADAPNSYGYSMSKAALNMAVRKLAAEHRGAGWRTVAVHPGWFRSAIGGPDAPMDAAGVARRILHTLDRLPEEVTASGGFVDLDGTVMPW